MTRPGRMRTRSTRFVVALFVAIIGFAGCGGSNPSAEECERMLDEFETTRRQKTLEARQKVIALQTQFKKKHKVPVKISLDEINMELARIKADMDDAVQQVGCE